MIEYWDFYLTGYDAPEGGMGTATTLPVDHKPDPVEQLRAVVEEVTGKPVARPVKPRMGFL